MEPTLPILPVANLLNSLRKKLAQQDRERRDRFAAYLSSVADTLRSMVTAFTGLEAPPTEEGSTFKGIIEDFPNVAFEVYSRHDEDDRKSVEHWIRWFREMDDIAENIDVVLAAQRSFRMSEDELDEVAWRDLTYRLIRDWVRKLKRNIGRIEAFSRSLKATSP